MAGIGSASLVDNKAHGWIIDTGATNHMVSDPNMLSEADEVKPTNSKQDLYSGIVKGIGKETCGLYILAPHVAKILEARSTAIKETKANNLQNRTCAYTPQQNGVAERNHRHILEVARAMRMPSTILNGASPFEKMYNRKPSLEHLRVMGCLCYAKDVKVHDKFMPRSIPTVLMGYSSVQKGYILLNFTNNCFFVNMDTIFKENVNHEELETYIDREAGMIPTEDTDLSMVGDLEDEAGSSGHSPIQEQAPAPVLAQLYVHRSLQPVGIRTSTRDRNPPIWLKDFVSPNVHQNVPYSIANYVNYSGVSPKYQSYLAVFSSIVEPSFFVELTKALCAFGFSESQYDRSLFVKKLLEEGTVIVLVYVDDMLVIEGILMHQRKYDLELISELRLGVAKLAITPLEMNAKLITKEYDDHLKIQESAEDDVLTNPRAYQRLIESCCT
ncbi:uncharacterized protein [Nicotiana sylvestris]|uniref:uncharacterized protein n=1 Tax=Nicotiana sylvestris TaxID=4096 RepID=UPI00388C747D